jgi:RNA polymerase sigma-70 factor (ECF subfamily)
MGGEGSMSQILDDFDVLLARAREGDARAQGQILDQFEDFLRRMAAREMDSRLHRRIDVSDIVQDTYVNALKDFAKFRGDQRDGFQAWLSTVHERVVQNLARRHIHTQSRSVKREDHGELSDMPRIAGASDSTPSAKVCGAEQVIKLVLALDGLPEDQCQAVRLRYCEDWALERIAKEMQRSPSAVAGLLKRGLKALRGRLARGS